MSARALTPANQITILRLVFVPVFAILVVYRNYPAALAILVAAAASDVVDGVVARVYHQESPLGIALDPIVDKILMTTAYLMLAFREVLPWWLTILVISRDVTILMTALLISLVAGFRPFHPTVLGKASTVVQLATIFVVVSHEAHVPLITDLLIQVFIYLAAALTVASCAHYIIVVRSRYAHSAAEQAAPDSVREKVKVE